MQHGLEAEQHCHLILCCTRLASASTRCLQHWEGLTRPDDAEKLAKAHGGTLRRIAVTSPPSPCP